MTGRYDDLLAWADQHTKYVEDFEDGDGPLCAYCDDEWPCPPARLAAALRESEEAREDADFAAAKARAGLIAARAEVETLRTRAERAVDLLRKLTALKPEPILGTTELVWLLVGIEDFRIVQAFLAEATTPQSGARCGARAIGGPCVLPKGHNMGQVDIPENHSATPQPEPCAHDFHDDDGVRYCVHCGWAEDALRGRAREAAPQPEPEDPS